MSLSPPRLVFLVGFMGSGKSSLGPPLAGRLGVPFLDLDAEIERTAGSPIHALFASEGEAGFRAREQAALERAIGALAGGGVIATGGGLFARPENRARITRAGGVSLWLDVPLATLLDRLPHDGSRPLLGDPGAVAALYAGRRPAYALADVRLDAATAPPAELVELALDALRRLPRPSPEGPAT